MGTSAPGRSLSGAIWTGEGTQGLKNKGGKNKQPIQSQRIRIMKGGTGTERKSEKRLGWGEPQHNRQKKSFSERSQNKEFE